MNDLSKKKVGDPVYGADGSEWRVTKKRDDAGLSYIFDIENGDAPTSRITIDGRYMLHIPPSFFSEPVRIVPAQGECDFSGYEVGDEVYTLDGCGRHISQITESGVWVTGFGYANLDGRFADRQLLFHAPPNPVASNPDAFKVPAHIAERKKAVDWANVPIDTLVVADTVSGTRLRYFAGLRDGRLTYWRFGATSLTVEDSDEWGVAYNMRLANEENTK